MRTITPLRTLLRRELGSSMVELALLMPLLLLILLGGIDFSRAYFLGIEVAGAAQAGAQFGIQNRTDTTGIENATTDDAPNVSGLTVATPTWGCECSDGTSSSTSCATVPTCTGSTSMVYWVTVTASAPYSSIFPWPHIPNSMTLAHTATLRSGN